MGLIRSSGLVALGLALLACNCDMQTPHRISYEEREAAQTKILPAPYKAIYKIVIADPISGSFDLSGSCVGLFLTPTPTGYIFYGITARHLFLDAVGKPLSLYLHDIGKNISDNKDDITELYPIIEAESSPSFDIAVFKAKIPFEVPVIDINWSEPNEGDEVLACGFPLGVGKAITSGFVGCKDIGDNSYYTSAYVTFGESGGAIIDRKTNKLIGIITGTVFLTYDGIRFPAHMLNMMVSLNSIKDWIKERGEPWQSALLK